MQCIEEEVMAGMMSKGRIPEGQRVVDFSRREMAVANTYFQKGKKTDPGWL